MHRQTDQFDEGMDYSNTGQRQWYEQNDRSGQRANNEQAWLSVYDIQDYCRVGK